MKEELSIGSEASGSKNHVLKAASVGRALARVSPGQVCTLPGGVLGGSGPSPAELSLLGPLAQDEARVQKVTERLHTLEEVDNSVKLLGEMLRHYSREGSAEADKELMKVGPKRGRSCPETLLHTWQSSSASSQTGRGGAPKCP